VQDIAAQAVSYAQEYPADPCVAMNLLEEAAAKRENQMITNAGLKIGWWAR